MNPGGTRIVGTRKDRVVQALRHGPMTMEELRQRFDRNIHVTVKDLREAGVVRYDPDENTFRLAASPAQGLHA